MNPRLLVMQQRVIARASSFSDGSQRLGSLLSEFVSLRELKKELGLEDIQGAVVGSGTQQ